MNIADEIKDLNKCTGCSSCSNICPKDAITMEFDQEGFWYPVIRKDYCIDCGKCIRVCPVFEENIKLSAKNDVQAFACINNDLQIRKESSSGGCLVHCQDIL